MKVFLDILVFGAIGVTAFLIYVFYWDSITSFLFEDTTQYTIYIDEAVLSVTLADSESERKQGLSGVEDLSKFGGKLFIFDDQQRHGIWMKDMLLPIDVMWFNDSLQLIHIEKEIQPDSYPVVFAPKEKARFIIEANAHFVDSLKIQLGDRLSLPPYILPSDIKENLQE